MEPQAPSGSRLVAEIAEAERGERTRLADRLHDEGLQLVLAARQEVAEVRDGDADAIDALGGYLDQAADALRSLTSALHEDVLTRIPLREAIARIGSDAARRGRFALELDIADDATGAHDALVRDIARELLANAARHAQARRVAVEVHAVDHTVVVRVRDDGRGIDPLARVTAGRAGHLGLGRLERVVNELGGSMGIDTPEGGGTAVLVRLPRGALAAQGSLEDALRGERRWSTALLAAVQDGIIVFRDTVTVQVNDAFCRMTGFPRDALLGTSAATYPFWPDEEREERTRGVADMDLRDGGEEVVDLVRSSGERFPALCSCARIDDPAGGEVGMLVTVKDLTERRRAEERRVMELELGATIETTRRLTQLLTAVEDGVAPLLDALGRLLVDHLGWRDAVVNLREERGDRWSVAWTSGPELAEALGGTAQRDANWAAYLAPRFARRGAWFVEAGGVAQETITTHVPVWTPPDAADAWLANDLLLVPLRRPDASLCGLISVDRPASGRRPTDTELDVLVAAGEHAAAALQLARKARDT